MGTSITEIRRRNLLELINDKFRGNRSAFSRAVGKNVNLINLCLTHNEEYRRNIGEKLARSLEEEVSLPAGWLDVDRQSSNTLATVPRYRAPINEGDMVPEALYVGSRWLTRIAGHLTDPGALALWHAHDDTMAPTITDGDVVLVDTGKQLSGAGLYLIEQDGAQQVRRLLNRPDGAVAVSTDNPLYDSVTLDPKRAKSITVIGRVIGRLNYSAL